MPALGSTPSSLFGGNIYGGTQYNNDPGNLTSKGGLKRALSNIYGTNVNSQMQTQSQRGSEYGALMPGYQSLLDSGYSPQEKSGIEQGTLGAIQGSYGSASDAAARRMARTNNSAGYGSFLGALARSKAKDMAQQELDNQKMFADEALRRKMMGLQGIAQLYGVDTSFLNSLNGQQLGVAQLGASLTPGFKSSFLGSFGSGLGSLLSLH